MAIEYDEIGIWSEVKLAIIKEYASAYTTILDAQRRDKIRGLKMALHRRVCGAGLSPLEDQRQPRRGQPVDRPQHVAPVR